MDNTETNLENEISAIWDSNQVSFSGVSCGAAEHNLIKQRAGETALTREERQSIGRGRTNYGECHFLYSGKPAT
jgi:hypothetical protein